MKLAPVHTVFYFQFKSAENLITINQITTHFHILQTKNLSMNWAPDFYDSSKTF